MRLAARVLVALAVAGCAAPESATQRYERWIASGHREQVRAYEAYLHERDVGGILPTPQLLRTGRRWDRCQVDEFSVPPRETWPRMVATLALVRDLESAGVLRAPRVASAWRSAAFNHCEGGSPQSRHLRNNALDFDVELADGDTARLCRFWRESGPRRRFGLGFYSPTRIHVDTAGFRTWGYDFHRASSLCMRAGAGIAAR